MLDQEYLNWPIYGLTKEIKGKVLTARLREMTAFHIEHCAEYASLLMAYSVDTGTIVSLEDVPFFPVRLFKSYSLRSVPQSEIIKELTSSGTTSQQVSRIYLDRYTAAAQTKALVRIVQSFLGKQRLPMLIIDHPGVVKDRLSFSARGAGILGLANFGRDHTYALHDESMSLDLDGIRNFLARHKQERILLFGFTFMVWKYLVQALEQAGEKIQIPDAFLMHSGGWKKLQDEAVDNTTFKKRLMDATGTPSVHNFYGMVEQVGSVFMECEHGYLHAPAFADILVRDAKTWQLCDIEQPGVIQVLSALPASYPGHSLLTEDIGIVHGEDNCPCGRLGKYFSILGRLPRAELRGCSDTHAADVINQANTLL